MKRTIAIMLIKFLLYMKRTWKNKVAAIGIMLSALLISWMTKDCTALILFGVAAVPLFFAKKNWMGF